VLRKLDGVPWWAKPIASFLARKEVRSLRIVTGIKGTPDLIRVDDEGILRSWSEGIPLNLAKPDTAEFYKDAKRILREMRARGVTHNDLAKPQNWLMDPDGLASVIDFQLASVHRRKGKLTGNRIATDGAHITADLMSQDGVTGVALSPFALPAKGTGIYAFVETALDDAATRALISEARVDLIQPVATLPRSEVLELIAMNRLDELEQLLAQEPELRAITDPIVANRLNLTDRRLANV